MLRRAWRAPRAGPREQERLSEALEEGAPRRKEGNDGFASAGFVARPPGNDGVASAGSRPLCLRRRFRVRQVRWAVSEGRRPTRQAPQRSRAERNQCCRSRRSSGPTHPKKTSLGTNVFHQFSDCLFSPIQNCETETGRVSPTSRSTTVRLPRDLYLNMR